MLATIPADLPPPPTARQMDDAAAVVNSPAMVAGFPALRAEAWATLLAAKGQRMNMIRISAMQANLRDLRSLGAETIAPPTTPTYRSHADEIRAALTFFGRI